jgi:hypothetical protein
MTRSALVQHLVISGLWSQPRPRPPAPLLPTPALTTTTLTTLTIRSSIWTIGGVSTAHGTSLAPPLIVSVYRTLAAAIRLA